MKRVAFLSFDWNYQVMSEYYEGMATYLAEIEGVQLVIFNAFGQYANYAPQEGSFDVFELCDLSAYDGFLIQGNRTWPPEMRQRIVDAIVALGKPVVSLNYELVGAHSVGTDNYEAEIGLVRKVLADRQPHKPVFVNGLATSVEAEARKRAYLDACAEQGYANPRVYQASWEMEAGIEAAQQMLNAPDDLPDAVFCCNDDLAVGVQETLQAQGIRVPEDVLITGFDNRDIGLKTQPRVTTIDRDYHTIGRTALEVLIGLMTGEERPQQTASPARYLLSESCGYVGEAESKEDIAGSLYSRESGLRQFFEVLTRFQPAVLEADSLLGVIMECERYFPEIRCPNVYLMINEDYLGHDASRSVVPYGDVALLMAHSGDALKTGTDERHVYARFHARSVLPPQIPMEAPVYMVYPLRHGTTCVGTLVTEGVSPILRHGFLTIILTLLGSSIESAYRREVLQTVNSRLDDLYVHDQLTGLFNRFGLERFGAIAYEHLLRDFEEAQFIFVDIDWMKRINDEYGHEAGDQALRDTADIITRAMRDENAFAMRYGGDEFLLICRRNLIPKLEHELALLKNAVKRPYDLSLSMGAYEVLRSDHYTVHEAIERADARMYEVKQARRARD